MRQEISGYDCLDHFLEVSFHSSVMAIVVKSPVFFDADFIRATSTSTAGSRCTAS